ncbi:Carboxynorspermidine synthase [Hypoxylon sp. FL1857]|nr:Carboxynorspermidine synthase [Hypoxylon sp. FL1857]
MKRNVLIIGAGGVGRIVAQKCAQNNDVLGDIHIASRTKAKCEAIVTSIIEKQLLKEPRALEAHSLNAFDADAVRELICSTGSSIVINVGSTFANMTVLDTCIDTGVAYIDTAVHEEQHTNSEPPPWYANHEWRRISICEERGITAVLGVGFDPGVVNAYARLAADDYLDEVTAIDIVDVDVSSHGRYFATGFNAEINFREYTDKVYTWQGGEWQANAMFEVSREHSLPCVGRIKTYLCGHDELHSLARNFADAGVRFWVALDDHFVNVFTVLNNLGLLSEKPVVTDEGVEVVPLKVVKACLPDPVSLAAEYVGKACIGTIVKGRREGREKEVFLYNITENKYAYDEVGSHAGLFTASLPPVAAAMLIATGAWDSRSMANVEQLPPKPFLKMLKQLGLGTFIRDEQGDRPLALE